MFVVSCVRDGGMVVGGRKGAMAEILQIYNFREFQHHRPNDFSNDKMSMTFQICRDLSK
jgi:hypothetical protein